jgi:hypothetical protein
MLRVAVTGELPSIADGSGRVPLAPLPRTQPAFAIGDQDHA